MEVSNGVAKRSLFISWELGFRERLIATLVLRRVRDCRVFPAKFSAGRRTMSLQRSAAARKLEFPHR
jgi:hypothetical protein